MNVLRMPTSCRPVTKRPKQFQKGQEGIHFCLLFEKICKTELDQTQKQLEDVTALKNFYYAKLAAHGITLEQNSNETASQEGHVHDNDPKQQRKAHSKDGEIHAPMML